MSRITGIEYDSPADSDPAGQEPKREKKKGKAESEGRGGPRFMAIPKKKRFRIDLRFPEFHARELLAQFKAAKARFKLIHRAAHRVQSITATFQNAAQFLFRRRQHHTPPPRSTAHPARRDRRHDPT